MSISMLAIGIALVASTGICLILYSGRSWLALNWRTLLSRLPLPTLALAASYGVYSYTALFVPEWVAVVQAAAYESTYIGLASIDNLSEAQRKRATRISVGAVVVSIVYNLLAGKVYRDPQALDNLAPLWEWFISFLHAAPIAIVAYFVADLLLHQPSTSKATRQAIVTHESKGEARIRTMRPRPPGARRKGLAFGTPLDEKTKEVVRLRDEQGLTFPEIGNRLGFTRQAAQQRYNAFKGSSKAA